MTAFLLTALVLTAQPQGPEVDAAQFGRLMKGLHSEIRDCEFIYEGKALAITDQKQHPYDKGFQGIYCYRKNKECLFMDIYKFNPYANMQVTRWLYSLLDGKTEELIIQPDSKRKDVQPLKNLGSFRSLNMPQTPARFVTLWYLQSLDDPGSQGYEFQGWEPVEGHRCLRVQFDSVPGAEVPKKPVWRMWFDMDRGGYPLRLEDWRGGKLVGCTSQIELRKYPLTEGKSVWFPTAAVSETFLGKDGVTKTPTIRETSYIVNGTLRFNQDPPDSRFSVLAKDRFSDHEIIKQARQRLDSAVKASPPPPPRLRTDPAGVKLRLDAQLVEADRQSARIEASSPARETWSGVLILQLVLAAVGIALLGFTLYSLRVRGRTS